MTETLSTSGQVAQLAPLANRVSRMFDSRPSLRSVARQVLDAALAKSHPLLVNRPGSLWLAWPRDASPLGQSPSLPLEDLLISRYLQNSTLNLIADYDYVTVRDGAAAPTRVALKISELESLINQWGPLLISSYQASLVQYWNSVSIDGISRWRWLSDHLREHAQQLTQRLAEQGRIDADESATLRAVLARAPLEGTACWLLRVDHMANPLLPGPEVTSDLVITRAVQGAEHPVVLLYSALSSLSRYPDLGTLAKEQANAIGADLTGSQVDFSLAPVDGELFDAQAMILLENQLSNIAALGLYYQQADAEIDTLEHALDRASSLYDLGTAEEVARLDRLQRTLPHWLDQASTEDSANYAVLLAKMAEAQRRSGGRSYLDGIDPIEVYAGNALARQIAHDHPDAPVALADIDIRLYSVPNALLEIVDAGDSHLEYVTITPQALALYNLNGRPPGLLEVEPRAGVTLPAWVTKEALAELVQKVDVGRQYLALLQRLLRDDTAQATRRQGLFTEQLRAQLPLKMLELKIRGLQGVTAAGVATLQAALPSAAPARRMRRTLTDLLHNHPTVRALAFQRQAGAPADTVLATYIIGPADEAPGARVLYSPMSREPLREFASAQALFEAIKAPGALHDAVLAGMDEHARAVYGLGGFDEPHITRFTPGDEAARPPLPEPAILTGVAIEGDLWSHFYQSTLRALERDADRQSVSNAENRWLGWRELGWLLFNSLLPLYGGPLATTGWMIQSLKAFDDGFARQLAGDHQAANDALIDFFFNTAFLLLTKGMEASSKGLERVRINKIPESLPAAPLAPVASRLTVQPDTPVKLQMLDFSFKSARNQLSRLQREALASFAIGKPAQLGAAVPHGVFKGLYLLDGQWLVALDGSYFAVAVGEAAAQVIDLDEPGRTGPWLRRDELGRWGVDTRMRLEGGSPLNARQANQAELERRAAALQRTLAECQQKQATVQARVKVSETVMLDLLKRQSPKYPDYRQRFSEATAELVEISGQALDAAAELNKARVTPRFLEVRASHLHALVILMRTIAEKRIEALAELVNGVKVPGGEPAADAMQTFEDYRQGCDSIDQVIRWATEAQRRMDELAAVEHFGPPRLAELKPTWARVGTPVEWMGVQLDWLAVLAEQGSRRKPRLDGPLADAVQSAKLAAQSQQAVGEPGEFTDEEQLQVLDSALQRYDELEDAMDFVQASSAQAVPPAALERLRSRLQALRGAAEGQLVPLLRARILRARQRRRQKHPVRNQVIVSTKKRGVVVGRLREGDPQGESQRLEVQGVLAGDVAAFERAPGSEHWIGVEPVPVVAPKPQALAPLEALMRDALVLLGHADEKLREAPVLAGKARIPSELQNLLDAVADPLVAKAEQIDRALTRLNEVDLGSSTTQQSADVTANNLRAKALQLTATGRTLRIELCKARDPEASRVEWLVAQGEVRIERSGARAPVKSSGDFIQEYAVKDGDSVLWYAHFHYPRLDTAPEGYSVAHLKTVAQRFLTYQQFTALADSVKGAKALIRAEILPNMARKLFLSVEGKQKGGGAGS